MKFLSLFMVVLAFSMTVAFPFSASSVYANDPDFESQDDDSRVSGAELPNQVLDGQNVVTASQAASSFCGPVNVKNSLVLSIVTMCFAGILEKTEQWRQIKCQAIVCHYEAVKNGLDPSFCTEQESFMTCSYIVGEVFAIPPMSILEYYRGAIADLLANPVGIIWGATAKAARASLQVCTAGVGCTAATHGVQAIFLAVTDISGVIQTVQDMLNNGFFGLLDSDEQDYCAQVGDIRSEMEDILGITN